MPKLERIGAVRGVGASKARNADQEQPGECPHCGVVLSSDPGRRSGVESLSLLGPALAAIVPSLTWGGLVWLLSPSLGLTLAVALVAFVAAFACMTVMAATDALGQEIDAERQVLSLMSDRLRRGRFGKTGGRSPAV